MNFPGPLSVSPINAPANQEMGLRLFQRVTAQILAVTGTTALLTVEGYPVVAQLTSADQVASLLTQKTAQFIVTQLTNQSVILKLVKNDQSQAPIAGPVFNGPELAFRLLEQQNIPTTVNHLMVARSLLKKHLPVTPGLLNEMLDVLSDYGVWGSTEAELAAALKAADLPVNTQSLALASRNAAEIGDSLANLTALLTKMAKQDLPADLLKQLDLNLQMLNSLIIKGDGETSQLAEQLRAAVQILGESLESSLFKQSQNPEESSSEKSLLSLIRLQQMLEQVGKNKLASTIGEFLNDLRQNQFLNAKTGPIPGHEWCETDFAIQNRQQKADNEFSSARLRIARDAKSDSGKINPAYTRLILQVDLKPGQTVEVDLSVVGKQIRSSVTAPDLVWCQQAQSELPTLENALQGLGFNLKEVLIDVGKPQPFEHLMTASRDLPLMTVNIEV